jgi:hypothetical protein
VNIFRIGLLVAVIAAVSAGEPSAVQANSVLLRTLIFDHSNTACAGVDSNGNLSSTATQTGVAFDGSRLLLSCWNDNTITAVSPVDGSQLAVYHISGGTDFGALSWDPTRNVLWACNLHEDEVGTIDLTTSTYTKVFTARGCTDALAWDPLDGTLWAGRDGGHTVATLEHYTTTGTLLGAKSIGNLVNDRSGVAFAGSRVFVESPHSGYPKHLWQTTRAFSTATILASWAGTAKAEDLECDGTTFSSPVIWVQWNHQNLLQAYQIGGTCGPPAGAELTVTQNTAAGTVTADSPVSVTSTVSDLGPAGATNATLSIPVPSMVTGASAVPSQGSCTGGSTIVCSLGTIASGASATVTTTWTPIAAGTVTSLVTANSDTTIAPAMDQLPVTVTAQAGVVYAPVTDTSITPSSIKPALGGTVQWNFLGPGTHSVRDASGLGLFDTGPITPVDYRTTTFTASGILTVSDPSTGHTATVAVPISSPSTGTVGTPIQVMWASAPLPAGLVEDVQVLRPGTSTWVSLMSGTTAQSTQFTATSAGKYQFRARLRNPVGGASTKYCSPQGVTFS